MESTTQLLNRARAGDEAAREALVSRYLPALRRFAHGRLPARVRGVLDTEDLVQATILRALNRIHDFESRHQGSLFAYLRQILLNRIRDEARREARKPPEVQLSEDMADPAPSPLEQVIGHDALARYERALTQLRPDFHEAVLLRIEMGCSYQEIAEALGRPTADSARSLTRRALLRLVEHLRLEDPSTPCATPLRR